MLSVTALGLGKADPGYDIPLQRGEVCLVYIEKLMDVRGLSKFLRLVGGGVNGECAELQGDAIICLLYYKSF